MRTPDKSTYKQTCPCAHQTYPCTNLTYPCTRTVSVHTHTPDTSPYTHTRPCANLRRPRTHTPDQHHMPAAGATSDPEIPGAGTRVGFSFPQAHTSVHVHAARCYLCNHIATPPRILPYKDIGSHCCALFMAFHTHTRMHTATALLQLRTR